MRLSLLLLLGAFACQSEPTVLGGDDASDTGNGAGDLKGDDSAADTADTSGDTGSGDTGKDHPACVGDWEGSVSFAVEDPRGGAVFELCSGDASVTIADDLSLTGEATCTSEGGGNPGDPPPADFALTFKGKAKESCSLSADVTITTPDATDTASATGDADAHDATLTWEGELTPPEGGPGGGPPAMPYTATITLQK